MIFFLFRAAENVVVVPDELDIGFIGIGPGQAKINPLPVPGCSPEAWTGLPFFHKFFDHVLPEIGQTCDRLRALAGIDMREGQFVRLLRNGVGDLRASISPVTQ